MTEAALFAVLTAGLVVAAAGMWCLALVIEPALAADHPVVLAAAGTVLTVAGLAVAGVALNRQDVT